MATQQTSPVILPDYERAKHLATLNEDAFYVKHFGTITETVLPSGLPVEESDFCISIPSHNPFLIAIYGFLKAEMAIRTLGTPTPKPEDAAAFADKFLRDWLWVEM